MKKIYGLLAVFCVVTACASDPEMDDWSAEQIYNKAFDDLEATKYKKAAEEFEKVETEHPYSKWAVKSKLMSAFAYYKDEKYDDAIIATDRFLKYHPGNKDAAYALYLKGICYYDQISAADKDQGDTQKAEEAFQYLIALFPNTPYAEDARKKINLTEDYKAGQEMVIGRFYLNEGNYLSALNRFNVVLENYQTTIQIEEALYREVEIYAIFGMNQYANGYYKILRENYPNGKWTAKAAEIMKRIGVDDRATVKTLPAPTDTVKDASTTEVEKSNSWFSGWFSSDNQTEDVVAEVEPEKTEKSSSWFSGWFGSSNKDEIVDATVEPKESWYSRWQSNKTNKDVTVEPSSDVTTAEATKSSSWFSGWFDSDNQTEDMITEVDPEKTEKNSSWFSSWFSHDDAPKVVAETPIKSVDLQPEKEFSYSGETDENRIVVASKEESKSWFSGWFGRDKSGK